MPTSKSHYWSASYIAPPASKLFPFQAVYAFVALGLVLALLLFGLLFIALWRCCVIVLDRRQYALFLKEAEMARYAANHNANDLYKSPITTFQNPMYGKKDS